jgi:archaetidylinositol phosphate synthase
MPSAKQQRTNTGWLEPLERASLAALAARMPSWVTPDFLTAIGFAGALITFAAYVRSVSS